MKTKSHVRLLAIMAALAGLVFGGIACQSAEQESAVAPLPEEELVLGTPQPPAANIPVEDIERIAREQAAAEGLLPGAAAKMAGYQIYNPVGFYSQCDPNWKDEYVGFSTKTFCSAGCLVTCVSMAYDLWGVSLNPKQLNTWGKAASPPAFSGVSVVFGRIADYDRDRSVKWISKDQIGQIYDYLKKGWPVLLETDYPRYPHWVYVFAFSKNGDGRYWAKDPLKDHTAQDQPLRGNFQRACVFTW